jgi:hypothetical protein
LLAPDISSGLATRLTELGWSWADGRGNYDLRHRSLILCRTTATEFKTRLRPKSLQKGPGSLRMMRWLLTAPPDQLPVTASRLAQHAGVSQPAASQLLGAMQRLHLAAKENRSGWLPDRGALLNTLLNEYPGAGGTQKFYYSLKDSTAATLELIEHAAQENVQVAVSADVGPDQVAPWRHPTATIVYAQQRLNPQQPAFIEAQSMSDANIIIHYPHDDTVFFRGQRSLAPESSLFSLADPFQMLWDLGNLGGEDREEAAGELNAWFLSLP